MKDEGKIEVIGARVHNLKNIHVTIPRKKLTVITGLSGSGKSSLAFDTIFAEGQRRYIDTFSAYARGYIGTMQRPDVDKITGLSPVISIDQKTTNRNPRSTVGTATEVNDFLRLLFARAGEAYSYLTGEKMVHLTDEEIINIIHNDYQDKRLLILAPVIKGRKGHYRELFESIRKKGFIQVRVDGQVQELVAGMKVDRYQNHDIEIVVDKLVVRHGEEDEKRLNNSIGRAMKLGEGVMMVCEPDSGKTRYMSRNLMCPTTGLSYQEPAPHSFSFNTPKGWCPCCKGLGRIERDTLIEGMTEDELNAALKEDDWYEKLTEKMNSSSLEGGAKDNFDLEISGEDNDENEEEEGDYIICPMCKGKRLNREALAFRIGDKNIAELCDMDIRELMEYLEHTPLNPTQAAIAEPIKKEICARLRFMLAVGLDYLSLGRSSDSLSGGENQRIRLATQIGSRLVNVLYILDEPSIGLHQRDNERLIESLKELRDIGNSVIVVEHDEQMMREADYIVDIGPRAGRLGGQVVFEGTPHDLMESDTLTAEYLRGEKKVIEDEAPKLLPDMGQITLYGCRGNNLKNVDVSFPLGRMIGITGVSGSGKSTLVNQTLYPILSQHFYRSLTAPLAYDRIEGIELIDKVIAVDQSPIGRTPRSNPATYTNVFNDIRALFAQLPESKIRGWKQGRFSFNQKGGRCEVCAGNGYKTLQMHFMPDVYVPCEACGGMRYNRETLEVRFKGKTIYDVLDMTVNQAVEFFQSQPAILKKIKTIQDVGLGYIRLGQASTTLSGGESQRMKLATELSRPSTGKTLYILDEPTTGLHFEDIRVLLRSLRLLVDKGNTVIIIEHNLDVIRACDYLIDMGPEGGRGGGKVVGTGTREELKQNPQSLTGRYL